MSPSSPAKPRRIDATMKYAALFLLVALVANASARMVTKPTKVFILAGQSDMEQWKLTGGDHSYRSIGSAIWFNRIGHAMGEAMKELFVTK